MKYKRLLLTCLLALFALFPYAQNISYRTGYVGDEVKLVLSPEYERDYLELLETSLNWSVGNTSDYEARQATTLIPSSKEKNKATVRINSYYEGKLIVECRYELVSNAGRTMTKYAKFEVTCSPVIITPSPRSISMKVGDDPVKITYSPQNSPSGKKVEVFFSSDNTNVAKVVDTSGIIKAEGKGTAIITLQNNMGPDATVSVKVEDNPKKIILTASPPGGEVSVGTKVYLNTNISGCDIYYSLDGSDPTRSYSSTISINNNCTLKAVAYKSGYETSEVLTEEYTIKPDTIIATCAEVLAGTDGMVYRVSGKVKSIENTTYGNWHLEDSTGELFIYGTRDKNGNTGKNNSIEDWGIEVGDSIIVVGPRTTYNDIIELVDVTVIDIKKNADRPLVWPLTCVAAINEAGKLSVGETSTQKYYVKGIISSIKHLYNSQYGKATFYISDDGTTNDQFYVYGSYYLEDKPWVDGNPQIQVGDNVIVYGKMTNYNGILEMDDKQNYIYSHNGKTKVTNSSKDINVILSPSGHATFYSSESAYKLPSGLSAKVVKRADNGKLNYETIIIDRSNGNIVPRSLPVMIESSTRQAESYILTAVESNATYTGTNLLRGSDEMTTTTGDGYHYNLSYGPTGTKWDNVFGWYWGAQSGAPFLIEGHRAWLVVPRSSTRAAGFTIEGESQDIETIDHSPLTTDCYYDLQGRRITGVQNVRPSKKGIYIRNGQKVVVK